MNVLREQVCHRRFGIGTIISQTESIIEVIFDDGYGIKKFIYPAAFQKHLTLSNAEIQSQMTDELRLIREQEEAEKIRHEQEIQKKREEERLALFAQKHAAAKKKRDSTKRAAV